MLEQCLLRDSILRYLELLNIASLGQWAAGRKSWGQKCLMYSHTYSGPLSAAKTKYIPFDLQSCSTRKGKGSWNVSYSRRTGKGKLKKLLPTNTTILTYSSGNSQRRCNKTHICILGQSFEQLSDLQTRSLALQNLFQHLYNEWALWTAISSK